MDKELPVSVWPEWKIIEKIGEGSFGKVYKAQRTEQGRSFYSAIKIITIPASRGELESVRSETPDDNSAREYFQNMVEECIQEVSTMEYFRGNSHIVSVEDFKVVEYLDEIGWDISIRMEYLTSFTDYCTGRELNEAEVIKLGCDLCMALDYCQQLQIIHRDIKPENIFVSRFGDFKLGDFGIARELERSMSGMSKKGTYSYMAPEMYRGENYDSRVDIYSLGIMLYKLRNRNRLPFLSLDKQLITYRDKENALSKRMAGEPVPKPAEAGEELSRIIRKACAYAPEDRYQTPAELYRALDDLRFGRTYPEENSGAMQEPLADTCYDPEEHEKTNRVTTLSDNKAWHERRVFRLGRFTVNRAGGRKKRFRAPWKAAAVVIGAIFFATAGLYFKLYLDEEARIGDSQMIVDLLEDNSNSTAQIDDFSTAIETITAQAAVIAEELPDCKVSGKKGEYLHYYDKNGKLIKALIYPEASDDGVYEEYYYWEERLFFAYTWTGNHKEELYYYDKRGKLIRWIDRDKVVHDNEIDSTEYTKRGEKYWKTSLEQFD